MMLPVRNFNKIALLLLLFATAGPLSAQASYSTGIFSVSSTKYVRFATENEADFHKWKDANASYSLLSKDEWHYLLQTRTNDAYDLYALGRIQVSEEPATYTNGLFILPDLWVQPDGVAPLNVDDTQSGYAKNTYSTADWTRMAAAGAVFLPAAGYSMNGTTPTDANVHGTYWTGTDDGAKAYRLQIGETIVCEFEKVDTTRYYSVRQVQVASVLDERDEQDDFEEKKDALDEGTDAFIYRTLYKTGSFNTLTLPFNVPDIEASPLAGAEVYELDSAMVSNGSLILNIRRMEGAALTAGTPYLIQWASGATLTLMHFEDITWDGDNAAESITEGRVTFHGFYGKTHINDATSGTQHLNLFLGANNTLYWPEDGDLEHATSKMLGFRAWFQIATLGGGSSAPIYRGMPTELRIVEQAETTTGVEEVQSEKVQCTKELRNGQLVIIRNGETFSINGQRL